MSRFSIVRHFLSIWTMAERRAALRTKGIYENGPRHRSASHPTASPEGKQRENSPERARSHPASTQQDSSTRSKSRVRIVKSLSPSRAVASDPSDHPRWSPRGTEVWTRTSPKPWLRETKCPLSSGCKRHCIEKKKKGGRINENRWDDWCGDT